MGLSTIDLASFVTVEKYNRCHDATGRFCPASTPGGASVSLPASKPLEHWTSQDPHAVDPTWQRAAHSSQQAYGGVLVNSKGKVLLRKPTGNYDGYAWTFPKGRLDSKTEHPAKVALREVREETGHQGDIIGHVPGTFKGGTSQANFYLMRSGSFDHRAMDKETSSVRWATHEEAARLIGQTMNLVGRVRDLKILEAAYGEINKWSPVHKSNKCHTSAGSAKGGQFCSRGDTSSASTEPQLTATSGRAWSGTQTATKTKLSKLEVGKLGEDIAIAYLKSKGMADARTLNVNVNNFPVDLIQGHGATEVKTGLVSNGKAAQQWRATIGQPGKAESAWLKTATPEQKRQWNEQKQHAILLRKDKAVRDLGRKLHKKVKASTITLILNPDTKTADVYHFKGFHLRIGWNGNLAKTGYVGSFKYGA